MQWETDLGKAPMGLAVQVWISKQHWQPQISFYGPLVVKMPKPVTDARFPEPWCRCGSIHASTAHGRSHGKGKGKKKKLKRLPEKRQGGGDKGKKNKLF